jgi:hypothetical protein
VSGEVLQKRSAEDEKWKKRKELIQKLTMRKEEKQREPDKRGRGRESINKKKMMNKERGILVV